MSKPLEQKIVIDLTTIFMKKERYHISLDKIGPNIIGFEIECKGYIRNYPAYMCDELTLFEDWMARNIKKFLNEIKNYPKTFHKMKI